MESQKTLATKAILEKKKKGTKLEAAHFLISKFTAKISSKQYSNGIKKRHRTVEQNQEPRNKLTHI